MTKFLRCLIAVFLFVHSAFCLAAIEITDSHGKYKFDQPPERIVVLNWALAEQLLELGVVPQGMADIEGYRRIANRPAVPASVIDVGDRLKPDLAKIRGLDPEIIIIGYSQRSIMRPLENIATIIYFKNFGKRYNNAEKSVDRFRELAKLFDKTESAQKLLEQRERSLAQLAESVTKLDLSPDLRFAIVVPPSNRRAQYWLLGENSLPNAAARSIGIKTLSAEDHDQFGVARLSLTEITQLAEDSGTTTCFLLLNRYSPDTSSNDALECAYELPYQNAFGGVMSIQYLGEGMLEVISRGNHIPH
ncbi:MAG: ABC transporter substrate-binding protein [Pseudomonadota bacterium]